MLVRTTLLLASCLASASAAAQVATLRPVDEAFRDDSLYAVRAQLLSAVARRDVQALLGLVDPNIRTNFGGDGTIDDFRAMWHITDRKADSELWRVLGSALAFGGTFSNQGREFSAPYTYARWPESLDAFEHVAIVGAGVRVRAEPSLASETLRTLTFAIVPIARNGDLPTEEIAERWVAIRLSDGRVGYVAADYVKSPIDYRAVLSHASGTWKLAALVAGD
jgi:hypothetical protein